MIVVYRAVVERVKVARVAVAVVTYVIVAVVGPGGVVFEHCGERVGSPAGGIDLAVEDLAERGEAVLAGTGRPDYRLNLVVVHELGAEFHYVGGVEHYHNLIELGGNLVEQRLLVFIELEVVIPRGVLPAHAAVNFAEFVELHLVPRGERAGIVGIGDLTFELLGYERSAGKVGALAARPGKNNYGRVVILIVAALYFLGVFALGRFVCREIRMIVIAREAHRSPYGAGSLIIVIECKQRGVEPEPCVCKALFDAYGVARSAARRTCARIDGVDRVFAKQAYVPDRP